MLSLWTWSIYLPAGEFLVEINSFQSHCFITSCFSQAVFVVDPKPATSLVTELLQPLIFAALLPVLFSENKLNIECLLASNIK